MDDKKRIRGLKAEENVALALLEMQNRRDISTFRRTKRFSRDDLQGIDFWIRYKCMWIPLQVKSSEYGVQEHIYRYGESVNAIVGYGDNLIPRIKRAIREYHHKFYKPKERTDYYEKVIHGYTT